MPKITIANDIITHRGTSDTLRNWCARLRLPYATVAMRYRRLPRPLDTYELFNPVHYKLSNTGTDAPNLESPTSHLRELAYHPALDLLPAAEQELILNACSYNSANVVKILRDNLLYGIDKSLKALAPVEGELGARDFVGDPMWVVFYRLPEAQRRALIDHYQDTQAISAELEYILSTLMPKAVAKLTGITPDGENTNAND